MEAPATGKLLAMTSWMTLYFIRQRGQFILKALPHFSHE